MQGNSLCFSVGLLVIDMILSFNAVLLIYLSVLVPISSSQLDSCCHGAVRLVNGSTRPIPHEGRVEICHSGHWKTICDDDWQECEAHVLCTQLGFAREGTQALGGAAYGEGSGMILEGVDCHGTELLLSDCSLTDYDDRYNKCFHNEDAAIRCVPITNNCIEGELRLTNSSVLNEGRVEICINGVWGTVCPNNSYILFSTTVCKQLGFSEYGATPTIVHGGLLPTYISDITCTGNEVKLIDCSHRKGTFTCSSGCSSAGVHCNYDIAPAPPSFDFVLDPENYANISWLPPHLLKRHGTLLGYSLNCSTANEGGTLVIETQNTTEGVQLLPFQIYQCCASAVNQAGIGSPSCELIATFEGAPTATPTNISWITLSNTSIILSWHAPLSEHQNGYIREYHVKLYVENDTLDGLGAYSVNYTTKAQFLVVDHLLPNTDYICKIAAFTTSRGPYSQPITVTLHSESYACINQAVITQRGNNASKFDATIMSNVTDIAGNKAVSETQTMVTYMLAAVSGALLLVLIAMTGVLAATYFCKSYKTEESMEKGGDVIYETVDESKDKLRKDSVSLSDRKRTLKLILSEKSIVQKGSISGNGSQASVQQIGIHGSFPDGSHRSVDGNYQPLIPPRGERKEKQYQCLSPTEEDIESLDQLDVAGRQSDLNKEAKIIYQSLTNKESKYQCLSPREEYAEDLTQLESWGPGGNDHTDLDMESKNTYQSLISEEPKEKHYQCLSPMEERVESMDQLENDVAGCQTDSDKEAKNIYWSLTNKETKESKYQCLSLREECVKGVNQLEIQGGNDNTDFIRESKDTYQSLINEEPEENKYQRLSPVQEEVESQAQLQSECTYTCGGDNQTDMEKENKDAYQSLIKDEHMESSSGEYQTLAEFTQHQ